ncbi:LacI family DNA-binding transcriptional regulator [Actinosynnema sp. NPDC053489]|uniref:LacI family DNA-binding transcriptional regulator n=1 Tax=Actinosynnema sp. NPDC053489 TaxID=3363916 RepID=UPI0037C66077
MAQRPTVYDVAERAGVSIATVSFAFTQPERVRKKTLDSVLAAAAALGYVPNASARGLAKGRTGAIGLYSFDHLLERDGTGHDAGDARLFPLYSDVVQRGVELECRRRGLALMLGSGGGSGHLPNVVDVAGRVDGLIAFAGAAPADALARIARRIPVVELGGAVRVSGTRTVVVDQRSGMRGLVGHLLREHGHRSFAYVGAGGGEAGGTAEFADRFAGYAEALADAGVPVDPPLPSLPGDEASTRAALGPVLSGGRLPDAFVCATDQEALVVLDVLREAGVDVPGRVAVTGFDDLLAARLAVPPLTTVRQPMEAVGRTAVRLLVQAGVGEPAPLTTEPVVRRSCGC